MTQRHMFWCVFHLSFRARLDSDHCLLGTRIPPHSEASGDPETHILGLALINRCSTPHQPSSPLRDQISMSWGPAFGRLPLCLSLQPKHPWSHYSVWFPLDSNPQLGFLALSGTSGWSAGVRVSIGAGHVMAYTAIGLR